MPWLIESLVFVTNIELLLHLYVPHIPLRRSLKPLSLVDMSVVTSPTN